MKQKLQIADRVKGEGGGQNIFFYTLPTVRLKRSEVFLAFLDETGVGEIQPISCLATSMKLLIGTSRCAERSISTVGLNQALYTFQRNF